MIYTLIRLVNRLKLRPDTPPSKGIMLMSTPRGDHLGYTARNTGRETVETNPGLSTGKGRRSRFRASA